MPPVGFEPTVPASKRQQTYALDRAATGTGSARNNNAMQMRVHRKKAKKQLGKLAVRLYRRMGQHCRRAVRNNELEDAET